MKKSILEKVPEYKAIKGQKRKCKAKSYLHQPKGYKSMKSFLVACTDSEKKKFPTNLTSLAFLERRGREFSVPEIHLNFLKES
ncbi:hypothetical protein CEXT_307461 [Caerostris extrusa]|uniref:Uncharacterized protein n=1 Tax=Caerostris extrusa TaxID=172846 RepID=A0AAV4XBT9_CAEEX|nr:hypothetical protein CEXT_307461 [Caerostris extrusa]